MKLTLPNEKEAVFKLNLRDCAYLASCVQATIELSEEGSSMFGFLAELHTNLFQATLRMRAAEFSETPRKRTRFPDNPNQPLEKPSKPMSVLKTTTEELPPEQFMGKDALEEEVEMLWEHFEHRDIGHFPFVACVMAACIREHLRSCGDCKDPAKLHMAQRLFLSVFDRHTQ